ncbi:MAG: ATP-binding protein [Lachnospiraceae bacterium]|nr:ATP-binding protein [Lachnospiraceae bacterium]
MFIGRVRELESLEETYSREGFGMTVIYGRRRIGKSTLISELVKDKKAIFYTSTRVGAERNLELFSEMVVSVLDPTLTSLTFSSVEGVLDYITNKLSKIDKKLVLVIDELPFWAEKNEALLSILQKYIDTEWLDKNFMLILCGSSLSFMEKKVLSEKSPIFGRRNSQIRLEPFNYREASLFVENYTNEEKAICYGITGGVAKYLALLDPKKTLDENIVRLFFRTDGYLFDETKNLLTQEFSDVTLVNNIIEQIAAGENTLNSIATKIHEKENTVLYSLDKLISVGLIKKKRCITEEKNKKKTLYVLCDYMFAFWYKFIPKAVSVIEIGEGQKYFEKMVRPNLHLYMGNVFEEMCKYYTLEQGVRGRFDLFVGKTGTWWGTETLTDEAGKKITKTADIDVVGLSMEDKTAIIGECKFKNEKVDKEIYDTLIRRSNLLSDGYVAKKYILFSLSGFTKWYETANLKDAYLITLDDMYK